MGAVTMDALDCSIAMDSEVQMQLQPAAAAATAAAPAAEDDVPHLPLELLALIVTTIPRGELASLRLSSSQFAAAAAPLLDSITFRQWPDKACSLKRLQHATRLNLDINLPLIGAIDASSGVDSSSIARSSSSCRMDASPDAEDAWQQLQQLVSWMKKFCRQGPCDAAAIWILCCTVACAVGYGCAL
jgi:hypothetical protein